MRVLLIAIIFLGLYFTMTEGSKSEDNQPVLRRKLRNALPAVNKKKKKHAAKSGRGNAKPRSKKKNGSQKRKNDKNDKKERRIKRRRKNQKKRKTEKQGKSKNQKKRKTEKQRKSKDQKKRKNKNNKKRKTMKNNKKRRNNLKRREKKRKNTKKSMRQSNSSDCTEQNLVKETNWKKQYKSLKIIYDQMSNKISKIEVFSNYSALLGEITNNGTSCGQATIDAYTFLSNCPSTVTEACDVGNFTEAYEQATKCQGEVTCSNFPPECKLTDKYGELRTQRKEKCMNKTFSGSFLSCMNYVKSNMNTDILTCVRDIQNSTGSAAETPAAPDTIETKTIFTEGDEVVEQTESYNPDTNEVTLSVPAHGSNVALTAIIGEETMVTSYDNYCVVGEPPANHTNSVSESSNSTDEADELDSTTIVKVYYLNVVEGEMTEAERDALPESFKAACQGKPIQKTKKVVVDEATYNQDNFDSVEGVRAVARQSGCSNQKVYL